MSSDEGGVVWVSVSSSVRRTRSSRGTLAGTEDDLFLFVVAVAVAVAVTVAFGLGRLTALFFATTLEAAFPLDFFAGALFLADARRFTARFEVGRLAERRADGPFRDDFADVARLAALRLAITSVLSEP